MKVNISLNDAFLLENIYSGKLAPVDKLLNKEEIQEVLDNYEYKGKTYSLPYFIFTDKINSGIIDCYYNDTFIATIKVESQFKLDFEETAFKIFKTIDKSHPGVKSLFDNINKYVLSGTILKFNLEYIDSIFSTKVEPGNIVFQSRNPPHAAHEAIVREYAPDLLYTTPYSTTKSTDYPFELKLKTYEKMKELYGVKIFVSTLPRVFAGPREALQNCLLFQNLGYKKIIIGRGKNSVGDFYTPTEPYEFCKKAYEDDKISIEPVWHKIIKANGVELKGSDIKPKYIDKGIQPPKEFMNPEISKILING